MSRKKFTEEIKHLYNKGILTEAAIKILKTEKIIKEIKKEQ